MSILGILPKNRLSRASLLYTLLFLLVFLYFEFFQVWYVSSNWTHLKKTNGVRILLVADPQLLGEHNEIPLLGVFTRWHSDRFIARNFEAAKYQTDPHIIIFLGDLFDEGSTATEEEANRYLSRFHHAFQLQKYSAKDESILHIFLPGDNDIGGEGIENVDVQKIKWFNKTIGDVQTPVIFEKSSLKLKFLKVNFLLEIPGVYSASEASLKSVPNERLVIALSHFPCIQAYSVCSEVLHSEKPKILLSSHSHEATYYQYDRMGNVKYVLPNLFMPDVPIAGTKVEATKKMKLNISSSSVQIDLRNSLALHEFVTPTCSYRMGKDHVGMSILNIDDDLHVTYTVMWFSNGFTPLYIYITFYVLSKVIFTPWILWTVFFCGWRRLKRLIGLKNGMDLSSEKAHLV